MAEFDRQTLKLLSDKEKLILKKDNDFNSDWDPIEQKIYSTVKRETNKFVTEDGRILFDDKNVELISGLNGIIAKAIQETDYPGKVINYISGFDQISKFNESVHKDLNDLTTKELEEFINPMQRQNVQITVDGLTGAGINTQFVEPLKQGIYKNIVSGSTIEDLDTYLQSFIQSDPERMGQFKKYSTQIARDALSQYDGQINARIAEEFGLDAFRYVGSLIEDSRPQCRRWVGKEVLLFEELPNELAWAYSNGTGMIPGTTPESFTVYRGGYNCRHQAIPFKLTKSQRAELFGEKEQKKAAEPIVLKNGEEIAGLTAAQKDLNLTYGKSPLTPNELKGLNLPDQLFILSDNGTPRITNNDTYYQPGLNLVSLGLNGERAKSTYFRLSATVHEYNHKTHIEKRLITDSDLSDSVKKGFAESKKLIKEESKKVNFAGLPTPESKLNDWTTTGGIMFKKYGEKFPSLTAKDVSEMNGSYRDTIGALTKGKNGWGHSKSYYKYKNNSQMEWFAHASENYWVGNPIFQNEWPELYDQMVNWYRTNIIQVYLKDDLK